MLNTVHPSGSNEPAPLAMQCRQLKEIANKVAQKINLFLYILRIDITKSPS